MVVVVVVMVVEVVTISTTNSSNLYYIRIFNYKQERNSNSNKM